MLENMTKRIISEELEIIVLEGKVINDDKITDIKLQLRWNKPQLISVKLISGTWKEYSFNNSSNHKAPIKYKKLANMLLDTLED